MDKKRIIREFSELVLEALSNKDEDRENLYSIEDLKSREDGLAFWFDVGTGDISVYLIGEGDSDIIKENLWVLLTGYYENGYRYWWKNTTQYEGQAEGDKEVLNSDISKVRMASDYLAKLADKMEGKV